MAQPHMKRTAWQAEVNKMRNAYKAPIPEEQVQAIVSHLVACKADR
jgi:hypothetical protein